MILPALRIEENNQQQEPNSLCEAFSTINISLKRKLYIKKQNPQVQTIIKFILSFQRPMDHENDFKRLLPLSFDPQEFHQSFENLKTKILAQAQIFHLKFAKPKYKRIDSKDIPQQQISRINSLVEELIRDLDKINCFSTLMEMIRYRVHVGTQCIL
jgi:hypothetical protein